MSVIYRLVYVFPPFFGEQRTIQLRTLKHSSKGDNVAFIIDKQIVAMHFIMSGVMQMLAMGRPPNRVNSSISIFPSRRNLPVLFGNCFF